LGSGGVGRRTGDGEQLHRVFAALTLAVVCWNLDLFALYYFRSGVEAEWWSRVFRTGVCLAPAILFHTTLLLAESHGRVWAGLLTAAYATGAVLAVANLHGDLVSRVTPHPWGWYIEPTHLYAVMIALLVVYLPLSIERISRVYRIPVSPRQRVQAKFWFLAALVQTPFALTNLLPVYGINVYPIGSLGNVLYVGIVAYAIARHRLMDVDYVVRKGVSFCLASALVLIPGSFLHVALAREFGTHRPIALTCISVAITLLAVILVPTLQAGLGPARPPRPLPPPPRRPPTAAGAGGGRRPHPQPRRAHPTAGRRPERGPRPRELPHLRSARPVAAVRVGLPPRRGGGPAR